MDTAISPADRVSAREDCFCLLKKKSERPTFHCEGETEAGGGEWGGELRRGDFGERVEEENDERIRQKTRETFSLILKERKPCFKQEPSF